MQVLTLVTDALTAVPLDGSNPFDGVSPDSTILGVEFNTRAKLILGGIWGAAFLGLGFMGIFALFKSSRAKEAGNVQRYSEAMEDAKRWFIAVIGITLLPVIFGAALALAG